MPEPRFFISFLLSFFILGSSILLCYINKIRSKTLSKYLSDFEKILK